MKVQNSDWFDRFFYSTIGWFDQVIKRSKRIAKRKSVGIFDEEGFGDFAMIPFLGMLDKQAKHATDEETYGGGLANQIAQGILWDPMSYLGSGLVSQGIKGAVKGTKAIKAARGLPVALRKQLMNANPTDALSLLADARGGGGKLIQVGVDAAMDAAVKTKTLLKPNNIGELNELVRVLKKSPKGRRFLSQAPDTGGVGKFIGENLEDVAKLIDKDTILKFAQRSAPEMSSKLGRGLGKSKRAIRSMEKNLKRALAEGLDRPLAQLGDDSVKRVAAIAPLGLFPVVKIPGMSKGWKSLFIKPIRTVYGTPFTLASKATRMAGGSIPFKPVSKAFDLVASAFDIPKSIGKGWRIGKGEGLALSSVKRSLVEPLRRSNFDKRAKDLDGLLKSRRLGRSTEGISDTTDLLESLFTGLGNRADSAVGSIGQKIRQLVNPLLRSVGRTGLDEDMLRTFVKGDVDQMAPAMLSEHLDVFFRSNREWSFENFLDLFNHSESRHPLWFGTSKRGSLDELKGLIVRGGVVSREALKALSPDELKRFVKFDLTGSSIEGQMGGVLKKFRKYDKGPGEAFSTYQKLDIMGESDSWAKRLDKPESMTDTVWEDKINKTWKEFLGKHIDDIDNLSGGFLEGTIKHKTLADFGEIASLGLDHVLKEADKLGDTRLSQYIGGILAKGSKSPRETLAKLGRVASERAQLAFSPTARDAVIMGEARKWWSEAGLTFDFDTVMRSLGSNDTPALERIRHLMDVSAGMPSAFRKNTDWTMNINVIERVLDPAHLPTPGTGVGAKLTRWIELKSASLSGTKQKMFNGEGTVASINKWRAERVGLETQISRRMASIAEDAHRSYAVIGKRLGLETHEVSDFMSFWAQVTPQKHELQGIANLVDDLNKQLTSTGKFDINRVSRELDYVDDFLNQLDGVAHLISGQDNALNGPLGEGLERLGLVSRTEGKGYVTGSTYERLTHNVNFMKENVNRLKMSFDDMSRPARAADTVKPDARYRGSNAPGDPFQQPKDALDQDLIISFSEDAVLKQIPFRLEEMHRDLRHMHHEVMAPIFETLDDVSEEGLRALMGTYTELSGLHHGLSRGLNLIGEAAPIAYIPRVLSHSVTAEINKVFGKLDGHLVERLRAVPRAGQTRSFNPYSVQEVDEMIEVLHASEIGGEFIEEVTKLIKLDYPDYGKRFATDPFEAMLTSLGKLSEADTHGKMIQHLVDDKGVALVGGEYLGLTSLSSVGGGRALLTRRGGLSGRETERFLFLEDEFHKTEDLIRSFMQGGKTKSTLAELNSKRARLVKSIRKEGLMEGPEVERIIEAVDNNYIFIKKADGSIEALASGSLSRDMSMVAGGTSVGGSVGDGIAAGIARGSMNNVVPTRVGSDSTLVGRTVILGPNKTVQSIQANIMNRGDQATIVRQGYDGLHKVMKMGVTTTNPDFHVMNYISTVPLLRSAGIGWGNIVMGMADGLWAGHRLPQFDEPYHVLTDYALSHNKSGWQRAAPFTRFKKKVMAGTTEGVLDDVDHVWRGAGGEEYTYSEVMGPLSKWGVFDGFLTQDVAGTSSVTGKLAEKMRGGQNPLSAVMEGITDVGETSELASRMGAYFAFIRSGLSPDAAAKKTVDTMVNYAGITQFEKKWMSPLSSFYTFSRHLMPRWIDNTLRNPNDFAKLSHGIMGLKEDGSIDVSTGQVKVETGSKAFNLQRVIPQLEVASSMAWTFDLFSSAALGDSKGAANTSLDIQGSPIPFLSPGLVLSAAQAGLEDGFEQGAFGKGFASSMNEVVRHSAIIGQVADTFFPEDDDGAPSTKTFWDGWVDSTLGTKTSEDRRKRRNFFKFRASVAEQDLLARLEAEVNSAKPDKEDIEMLSQLLQDVRRRKGEMMLKYSD